MDRTCFRFDGVHVNVESLTLVVGGEVRELTPLAFQVLIHLIRNPERVVSKQELFDEVWGARFVSDNALTQVIREIRRATRDSPRQPRYIRTVVKQGYQFIGELVPDCPPSAKTASRRLPELPRSVTATLLTVLALGALFLPWVNNRTENGADLPTTLTITPLDLDSGGDEEAYLAQALVRELAAQISTVTANAVQVGLPTEVSRSVLAGPIGLPLSESRTVEFILKGRLRRSSDHLDLDLALLEGSNNRDLWRQGYHFPLSSLPQIEREAALAITVALEAAVKRPLKTGVGPMVDSNPKARDHYLRGRFYWHLRTSQNYEKARRHFEQALVADPLYAPAYSGLADTYTLMAWYGIQPPNEALPRAKRAALKSLDLDEQLAEAHASLGIVLFYYDWNWDQAEEELIRAIELDPTYQTARYWYAVFLADLGRYPEAVREMERALWADPLSARTRSDLGWAYFMGRDHNSSLAQLQAALELDPENAMGHHAMAETYLELEHFQLATDSILRALELYPGSQHFKAVLGFIKASEGNRSEAEAILNELEQTPNNAPLSHDLAALNGYLGDLDTAFEWLEEAWDYRNPNLVRLATDPRYDPLRDDPRFEDLLSRVGLDR